MLWAGNSLTATAPKVEYPEMTDKVVIQGNSVQASNSVFQSQTLGFLGQNPPRISIYKGGLGKYKTLLSCLIPIESSWNELAYNPKDIDGLPKYGLLQFEEETFKEWCVDKYEMKNDIWSGQVQVQCFNLMVADGQIGKWPPAIKYCQ